MSESEKQHEGQMSEGRRSFLGTVAAAVTGVMVLPVIQGCDFSELRETPTQVVGNEAKIDVSSMTADGEILLSSARTKDNYQILVVRKNATTYVTLSSRCTHQACEVGSEPDRRPAGGPISCGCHLSEFDLDGNVIQGLAKRPLEKLASTFDPNTMTVTVTLGA